MRPSLILEDEEVKRKLVKCHPWAYSELIRSNIPELSGAKPARPLAQRPSPPSVMKPSLSPVSKPSLLPAVKSSPSFALEPPVVKRTQGELQALVEVLTKKKRSIKRKTQASLRVAPCSG